MHRLKLVTLPTCQADTFDVRWTNTAMRPRGVIRVKVTARIRDRNIAAELGALKYLLEEKEVLGNNQVGHGDMELVVSLGAIRKLHLNHSDKGYLVPYANFLTTRFAGSRIRVDKDTRWFDGIPPETVEHLLVTGPQRETVAIAGMGTVAVTQHALEQYAKRFLPEVDQAEAVHTAWRKLLKLVNDQTIREVARETAGSSAKAMKNARRDGRFFMSSRRDTVLVVAKDVMGEPQIVTLYPSNHRFIELPKAA